MQSTSYPTFKCKYCENTSAEGHGVFVFYSHPDDYGMKAEEDAWVCIPCAKDRMINHNERLMMATDAAIALYKYLNLSPFWAQQMIRDWLQELHEQRCEDCNTLIEEHDNINWRFTMHPIRCHDCANRALASGYAVDEFEAYYVV